MKRILTSFLLLPALLQAQPMKTSMQIHAALDPRFDVRPDVAIVYGMDSTFSQRIKSYSDKGYQVEFITGIAWGGHEDYFNGKFDGSKHEDEGQVNQKGDVVGHGKNDPYVVPTESYIAFMKTVVKKAIDAGAKAIYLEEPEFWAKSGYSGAFKREWQKFYGSPWVAQHTSPEATYLSSKLKYHLYFHALEEVFSYVKQYSDSLGKRIPCYVPTHSLINYSSWEIVSPEASLASLRGMDGYIAQIWTGTAREPNFYNGIKKERVFETAWLEYGSVLSMTAPSHRTVYFLTDPIEDWPRTWDDYKRNYEATFTAELMYPSVDHFEVMPWPNRIYLGKFKMENNAEPQPMPPDYATQVQVMVNALQQMPASSNTISGSRGIGVLLGNSMMFQRFPTHENYTDPQLSDFYGMVMPLVKRGIPVETVHMENLGYPESLQGIKVLIMSYSNMKPLSPMVHEALQKWVWEGGVLIYYGRDNDPFQRVKEWWNSGERHFSAPSADLFRRLGREPVETAETSGAFGVGKGWLYITREDPKELVMKASGDSSFFRMVREAYEVKTRNHSPLETKNQFQLRRGPYLLSSVMEESVSPEPLRLNGHFIDLFNPGLPVLTEKTVSPGMQSLLYDLDRDSLAAPHVLAGASRVYEERTSAHRLQYLTKSPGGTRNVQRIKLPSKPAGTIARNAKGRPVQTESDWDEPSHTVLLRFVNEAEGITVSISF